MGRRLRLRPTVAGERRAPPFTPGAVDDVASLGVRTIYVQVANPDTDPATKLTDAKELQAILDRAQSAACRWWPGTCPRTPTPLATTR
ncbi:MAG: hypothetical protein U0W40_17880 [Acidimicrobiia bacterium]